ncbi:MAG TPA: hypothetical protein ENK48_05280 [Gammaproteobacteria bacterium]|nr:hypothetical protein [Gammaproteobacteria bacterium]
MNTSTARRPQGRARYRIGSIFYQSAIDGTNAGWYITIHGGNVYGPFREKDVAETILAGLLKKANGDASRTDH